MKKSLLLFLVLQFVVLMIVSSDVYSQWYRVNSGTTNNLNSAAMTGYPTYDGIVIAGNNGTLLKSVDGGNTWSSIPININNDITSVYISSSFGLLCGSNGLIMRTTNTGENWTIAASNTSKTLNSIFGRMAVGDDGLILKSTNSGIMWEPINSNVSSNLSFVIGGTVYYVTGDKGTLIRSGNNGANWTVINSGVTENLNFYRGFGSATYIGTDNGKILKSTDNGNSWVTINLGVSENIKDISEGPFQNWLYLCGSNGLIMKSTNNGQSWLRENSGTTQDLNNILHLGNYMICIGNGGTILKTKLSGISSLTIDANEISTYITNYGSFNRDPITGNSGFEWPKGENKKARYASGLWLAGIVDNETLVTVSEYDYEFYPGYTDNSGNPVGIYDTNYTVYKLTSGVTDYSRRYWPNALLGNSDQGAPVYLDILTGSYKPLDMGDQTIFCAFTDSYPERHGNYAGRRAPLMADIKLLTYAVDSANGLGRTIFQQYMIINRSNKVWKNFYAAIWTDDDIGSNASADLIGVDSALQLCYTYKAIATDPIYTIPPAVGFAGMSGFIKNTGNTSDTAKLCMNNNLILKSGYKNLGLTSMRYLRKSDPSIWGEPQNYRESYRSMKGLLRDGSSAIHPLYGHPTVYFPSGDPVTNTGWLDINPADRRSMVSTGPVDVNPNDTQYFVIAQVIAQGTSNINSITKLRETTIEARNYYNECRSFNNYSVYVPSRYFLHQNYPNPFNPVTRIKFELPLEYNNEKPNVTLSIYDITGRLVDMPVNSSMHAGVFEIPWDASKYASGVYFYTLTAGSYIQSKKLVFIK